MNGSDLARAIFAELPRGGPGAALKASHVAAILLLECRGALTVTEIGWELAIGQASASDLVAALESGGWVAREPGADARQRLIVLAPKALQWRKRRRGNETKEQAAEAYDGDRDREPVEGAVSARAGGDGDGRG